MRTRPLFDDPYILEFLGLTEQNPPRVFLSHSHKDKPFVRALAKRLHNSGIKVWIDEAEFKYGDSLIGKLQQAIEDVDLVIAVISANSVKSTWVQKELEMAMTHEVKRKKIKVIPLLLAHTRIPAFLEGKLYADFSTQNLRRKNYGRLIQTIFSHCRDSANKGLQRTHAQRRVRAAGVVALCDKDK